MTDCELVAVEAGLAATLVGGLPLVLVTLLFLLSLLALLGGVPKAFFLGSSTSEMESGSFTGELSDGESEKAPRTLAKCLIVATFGWRQDQS